MSGFHKGDRVRVLSEYTDPSRWSDLNGQFGTLDEEPNHDATYPYYVRFEDNSVDCVFSVEPAGTALVKADATVGREEVEKFITNHGLGRLASQDLYHLLGRAGVQIN